MAVIKTENLTYVYGEGTPFRKTAVDNVNIEINDGEMVGIIGHTGSGKSTLIQHFNGLLKPTSGSVYIDGERLWDDKSRLRPISILSISSLRKLAIRISHSDLRIWVSRKIR